MNKRNLLVFVLILMLMLAIPSMGFAFSGGSGTAADPYLISSPAELNEVRNN